MSIYVYNCNHKNEYLTTINQETLEGWKETATLVPNVTSETVGKSFAFNKQSQQWDIQIDDWRGILLFYKKDSRLTRNGKVETLPQEYTNIIPPDNEKHYIFENNEWKEYIQPDPQERQKDFKAACLQFKTVCQKIGQFIGDENFKGGFDEYTKFITSEAAQTDKATAGLLASMWSGTNQYCKYQGEKIGYGQPQWWYRCWQY